MLSSWIFCTCLLPLALTYSIPGALHLKDAESILNSVRDSVQLSNEEKRGWSYDQPCQSPDGQIGQCVPRESCILQEGNKDYILEKDYSCVLNDKRDVGVCCPYQKKVQSFSKVFRKRRISRSPAKEATSETSSSEDSENAIDKFYPIGDYKTCGLNGKTTPRSTVKAPTNIKEWPWMVAFVNKKSGNQFCGGTIITKRHVLTAAHCFVTKVGSKNAKDIFMVVGDYDLSDSTDSKAKTYSVEKIILHEDFDMLSAFEADIAIVVMNQAAKYNSYIQPCCLPAPGANYVNITAVVTGWGSIESKGNISSKVLREVQVPVWEHHSCISNYSQTVFDTNLCAGASEGGKDACQGDSGGPLAMQRQDGRWIIVGVVSWGSGCGDKNRPGVYTKVNDYLDWIKQNIS